MSARPQPNVLAAGLGVHERVLVVLPRVGYRLRARRRDARDRSALARAGPDRSRSEARALQADAAWARRACSAAQVVGRRE